MYYQPPIQISYGIRRTGRRWILVRAKAGQAPADYEIVGEYSDPLSEGDLNRLRVLLTDALASGHTSVNAVLPAGEGWAQWMETSLTSSAKARKIWPTLLDVQLPFSIEDCACAFLEQEALSDGAGYRALAVTVRRSALDRRLDEWRSQGIDPVIIDYEPFVLWSFSIHTEPPVAGEYRVLAHLGETETLLVFGRGEEWHSMSTCAFDIAGGAADDPEQAQGLITRLRRAMASRDDWKPVGHVHWYWAGPGSEHEGLLAQLESAIDHDRFVYYRHRYGAYFAARAMAHRPFETSGPRINWRSQVDPHPAERRWQKRFMRRMAAAYVVASILLAGLSLGVRAAFRAEHREAQAALRDAVRDITGIASPQKGVEAEVVERFVNDRLEKGAPLFDMRKPSLRGNAIHLLDRARLWNLTFDRLKLDDRTVSIDGTAEDWDRPEMLAGVLREWGYEVDMPVRKASPQLERVLFRLEGRRAE